MNLHPRVKKLQTIEIPRIFGIIRNYLKSRTLVKEIEKYRDIKGWKTRCNDLADIFKVN